MPQFSQFKDNTPPPSMSDIIPAEPKRCCPKCKGKNGCLNWMCSCHQVKPEKEKECEHSEIKEYRNTSVGDYKMCLKCRTIFSIDHTPTLNEQKGEWEEEFEALVKDYMDRAGKRNAIVGFGFVKDFIAAKKKEWEEAARKEKES